MNLEHLIYKSQAIAPFKKNELDLLISGARFNNLIYQVTGLLLYGHHQFIQIIEGSTSNIDIVFNKIKSDGRHKNIELLERKTIVRREFTNWNMGLVNFDLSLELQNKLSQQQGKKINFENISQFDASFLIKQFISEEFHNYVK